MNKATATRENVPVTFYLPRELFNKLETLRGYEKRAAYLQRHFVQMLNTEFKKKNQSE